MKKIIPFIIGILMITMVLAQPVPAPVTFKVNVNGYQINYDDVQVLNTRTGEKLTSNEVGSLKIVNGIGFFDLSEFELGYQPVNPIFNYAGDKIDVRVCDVHSSCTFSFYIKTRDPIENTYKIIISDTAIPLEKYVEKIRCWDGSEIFAKQSCPEQPTKVEYICSDGTKVDVKENCSIKTKEHADEIVRQILTYGGWTLALGFAGLYLYYRRKKQYARAEKMAKTYIERRKK